MKRVFCLYVFFMLSGLPAAPAAWSQVSPDTGAVDLFQLPSLDGWEVTDFGGHGEVEVAGDSVVILHAGNPMTGITWTKDFPLIDYEVSLDAKRVAGGDFFSTITFPVRDSHISLVIGGWGGGIVGLSSINGFDASENATSSYRQFERDRWYAIRLRVTGDSIRAWIDDEPVVDFEIGQNELSIRVEVSANRPFGLSTYATTGVLRNLKLRRLKR